MFEQPPLDAVRKSLSRELASKKLPDSKIDELMKSVIQKGWTIKKIDVCSHGICIDYFGQDAKTLPELVANPAFDRVDLFPYGIIVRDLYMARAAIRT